MNTSKEVLEESDGQIKEVIEVVKEGETDEVIAEVKPVVVVVELTAEGLLTTFTV